MKNNKTEPIPVMDYRQYRRARKLVHECCNYIAGNCIALDDGEALEKTERLIETLKAAPDNLSSLEEGDVFSNIAEKVLVNKNKRIIFRLINGLELTGWEGIEDGKE